MFTSMTPDAALAPVPTRAGAPAPPRPRGPLTAHLLEHLLRPPHPLPPGPRPAGDMLVDDDAQLALYCCYELHYRSFDGVADGWEWEPTLLALRRDLERRFEERLHHEVGPVGPVPDVGEALADAMADTGAPSLSRHLAERGTLDEMREVAVHRSVYQLKEADPHTWGIPRLHGGPKAALVSIQLDEYGGGVEAEMHATLFATTMRALALDAGYGAYLDLIPGVTLATVNLVTLFGLHRRWRGALAGHLAVFESTSVGPMGRYSAALGSLGLGPVAQRFYDVHVVADDHHQVVACQALAGGLVADEPALAGDVVFGARALMAVESRFSSHVLGAWGAGRSSLLAPPVAVDGP